MFWKRKKKPESPIISENRIDTLANRLHQEGRIEELESKLSKFDPEKLEGAEKESWYHLYGVIPFQQGNRSLAFERFREGVRQCPDSGFMFFSLGQEHEFRGETVQMFECFDKAMFPKVPAEYALAEAKYSYLWNRTDKGWSYIDPLMHKYFDLKILDSTFLHLRELPFFEQPWAYLAAFSQLDGDFKRLTDLTQKAESECHDLDFNDLKAALEGFRSGDFSILKEKLRSFIQKNKSDKFPCGYQAMQLHVLLAQETNDTQEAFRLLDSVELTDDDFHWLEDIRLLAKCELAQKAGDNNQEAELQKQFLKRQAMLFEPDNAINFNLLKYQENLKHDYQKNRHG